MSKQLLDKVAFITGAASGIGLEIARIYAREGVEITHASAWPPALCSTT